MSCYIASDRDKDVGGMLPRYRQTDEALQKAVDPALAEMQKTAEAQGMLKGTVTQWNDEKGFGFIIPLEGGNQDIFVHVSAFGGRGVMKPGELVFYKPPERNPRNDKLMTAKVFGPGIEHPGAASGRKPWLGEWGNKERRQAPPPGNATSAAVPLESDMPPEYRLLDLDMIRTRLTALYCKHRPDQACHVDALLGRFPGKEAEVLWRCEKKFRDQPVVKPAPKKGPSLPPAAVGTVGWRQQEQVVQRTTGPKFDQAKWDAENERLLQASMAAEVERLRQAAASAPITPASARWAVTAANLEQELLMSGPVPHRRRRTDDDGIPIAEEADEEDQLREHRKRRREGGDHHRDRRRRRDDRHRRHHHRSRRRRRDEEAASPAAAAGAGAGADADDSSDDDAGAPPGGGAPLGGAAPPCAPPGGAAAPDRLL